MTDAQRNHLRKLINKRTHIDQIHYLADSEHEYLTVRYTVGPRERATTLFTRVIQRNGTLHPTLSGSCGLKRKALT